MSATATDPGPRSGAPSLRALRCVALAGNPNSGKTTLFNGLTGLRQKVANYPGVTVERKSGRCPVGGAEIEIVDLPGTYSLVADSPDERVAAEVLRGLRADTPAPDAVVAVVDASNLARNLYLVSQLVDLGLPLAIALNMSDLAERAGAPIDAAALSSALGGIPVVPVVGHRGIGLAELKAALPEARPAARVAWDLPAPLRTAIGELAAALPGSDADAEAARLLTGDRLAVPPADAAALLERLRARLLAAGVDPVQADIEARYRWIDGIVQRCVVPGRERRPLSAHIDAVLLHRFWGLGFFAAIMATLFVSIFWLAKPLMDASKGGVEWLGALAGGLLPDGPFRDLVVDGIFGGVGNVIVFVPQIALLFLFLAVLEDSGYLARAAFLMDRLLAKVGLNGKSFVPLLSSFACAIPGVMAARTIEHPRERLGTILVAPFMSCSARLPVYGLVIGAFFAAHGAVLQGLVLLGCYMLGIVAAAATAWAFSLRRRDGTRGTFILELPPYKRPQASLVARQVYTNTAQFVKKAGTIILCLSILLWALAYYPRLPAEREAALAEQPQARDQAQREHSLAGRLGHAIEPAIAPLGFDWKIGVGIVGAFAAREVFNSYLGIIYGAGDPEDAEAGETNSERLQAALTTDRRPDGRPVWTPLVAANLLIWFVLAMQCISTVAVVRREAGTWRFALLQLVYMNGLAYVVCLAVYQVGSRIWGG